MRLSRNQEIKVGSKLQKARLANGYTQEQVAEIIGCSSRYVGQLETNNTSGSISLIVNLCKLYHITLNDLYGEYMDVDSDLSENISFCGYINLNDEYKSIIDNNINYLNQLQNDKK